MKLAFVTNICPHYRVKTFETLARQHTVDYYFFSAGDEWYWQQRHGVQRGAFHHTYLPGVRVGGTRITPTLPFQLLAGGYDAYIKCINGRFALPITYLAARLRRKPFILWTGIWQRINTPAHRLFYPLTRYFYQHADAVVVYGEHIKRFLIGAGVRPERIFIAHHAIDNDSYNMSLAAADTVKLRERIGVRSEQPIVLYLGRIEEAKGIAYLIEGFAALQRTDAMLLVAGDGAIRADLERQVAAHGLGDRVRFLGYVPAGEAWQIFALADLVVVPSITMPTFKEPWGLVVNEAFNQGVPVIASEAVGAAAGGLVRHGENGLIVPERDSAALARAMQLLLDQPALRDQMGRNARGEVARWDNERMVRGFGEALSYATQNHR